MNELIREWTEGIFRLELFDTEQLSNRPQYTLAYKFYCNDQLIFEGSDFGCSPVVGIDSDQSVASLLSFLSLMPGDTDKEYFENYSDKQMQFAIEHGEYLRLIAMELRR